MQVEQDYENFLKERRAQILSLVQDACARAGRSSDEVQLLAVSKTVGPHEVELAWKAGYRAFGENRPQELRRKLTALADLPEMADARFDMIGNLQTNKINMVLGSATLIHSVSSLHLAEAISKRACAKDMDVSYLIEANVSGEESKSGLSPQEVTSVIEDMVALPHMHLEGLMTMAPAHDSSAARKTFSGLRELRDKLSQQVGLSLGVLSCGMSDDFTIAIEEGSTLIRLGRTVFSPDYQLL
ncbi:MAG: YggS family pyridoxal phosphate-dependent enzyme [Atopobiaceae bacterium]|jgi:pyridoxal phosphate enzyme (YggS family)